MVEELAGRLQKSVGFKRLAHGESPTPISPLLPKKGGGEEEEEETLHLTISAPPNKMRKMGENTHQGEVVLTFEDREIECDKKRKGGRESPSLDNARKRMRRG